MVSRSTTKIGAGVGIDLEKISPAGKLASETVSLLDSGCASELTSETSAQHPVVINPNAVIIRIIDPRATNDCIFIFVTLISVYKNIFDFCIEFRYLNLFVI
jgi:hypothetical protein